MPADPNEVADLLDRWWSGDDPDAFGRLYVLLSPDLLPMASAAILQGGGKTPTYSRVDLVQTVFRRVLTAEFHDKPETKAKFKAYCRAIMNNYVLERRRKRSKLDEGTPAEDVPEASHRPEWQNPPTAIFEALQELRTIKPRQASAIELDAEGMTYAEIAKELSVEVATVGRDLRHGKRFIQEQLGAVADSDKT